MSYISELTNISLFVLVLHIEGDGRYTRQGSSLRSRLTTHFNARPDSLNTACLICETSGPALVSAAKMYSPVQVGPLTFSTHQF